MSIMYKVKKNCIGLRKYTFTSFLIWNRIWTIKFAYLQKKQKKIKNKYKLATQNHINIFTNINISLHKYGIAFGVILKYVRVS